MFAGVIAAPRMRGGAAKIIRSAPIPFTIAAVMVSPVQASGRRDLSPQRKGARAKVMAIKTKAMPPVKTKLLIPDMGRYLSDNADLRDFSTSLNNEALRASTMPSACTKFQRVGSPCCMGT
jgi:hypothetical protein